MKVKCDCGLAVVELKSGKSKWLKEIGVTCAVAGRVSQMLNDSFVQSYQSVAWQDDSDVIVHSSKFDRSTMIR